MKFSTFLLPAVALGGAAMLLGPAPTSEGYSLLGGSLGTSQRDVRIFNNFTDATANNNQTADDQFPGHQGAAMAIWKAVVEWGSEAHGDGTGDPTQGSGLGSGGANFDAHFQGDANGIGSSNNNIHSEISGSSGGVLAYCETPISDGWRIRYYSGWTWQDGPGSVFSGVDLQGVACHEYGHALGLGHSGVGGATMFPSISGTGTGQRSIAGDDQNGVKAIYGTKSSTKPVVTGVSVVGSNVTITGSDFSTSNNQVWFTNKNTTSTGGDPTVKVTGLASSGGGTQIVCPIPTDAGPGDLLVKKNTSGNASLSNAWPVDVTGGGSGGGFQITSITPSNVNALNVGTSQVVTINGSGFTATTEVAVNGVDLFGIPSPWTVVNSNTITFDPPNAPFLGPVNVTVTDGADSDTAQMTYVANPTPALQAGDGNEPVTFFTLSGLQVACAADPGSIFVLIGSTSNLPSSFPGFFNLSIGNNLTNYLVVTQPTIGANGLAEFHVPTAIPPLTTFYLQGVVVDPGVTFPLEVSNVMECQSLF